MSLFNSLGFTGGALAVKGAYDRLGDVGDKGLAAGHQLAQQGMEQTQFNPYTVTSSLGGAQANKEGLNFNLAPGQQNQMNQLGRGAQGFFSQAMGPTAGREQEVYDRIRAMQGPAEERQRLALEERLHNQGRLGVRTSMFGGTPEQFSMDQAQAEAQNQAALMAMQQAQAQQAQQATIGQQMMQSQYLPQAALMQQFQQAQQNAELAQRAQLHGANLFGQGTASGLDMSLGASLGQANLMGQLGTGLMQGAFSGIQQSGTGMEWLDNLIGWKPQGA